LPELISALTPITSREALQSTKDALITAFMTSNLFIVLPILTEASKKLWNRNELTAGKGEMMPDVIVPASFNLRGRRDPSGCVHELSHRLYHCALQ